MAEREQQHEYWNANLDAANLGAGVSDSQESLLEELTFSSVPDIEQMIAHLAPAPGKVILEIGSGLGANAVLLASKGATVIALDLSHDRLSILLRRTANVPAAKGGRVLPIKAKAEALPFRAATLDGVCSRAVLIHTDLPRVCDEVARALVPGAPIAFSEPMAHNPLVNIYRATLAPKEWQGITTYFTRREVDTVRSRFSDTADRRFYGLAFLAFGFQYAAKSPRWFYPALSALSRLDTTLAKFLPAARKYAWFTLITGRKSS